MNRRPRLALIGVSVLVLLSLAPCLWGQAAARRATLIVRLAPDAQLEVQGEKTYKTGEVRRFVSPPLEADQDYSYKLRATWTKDGQELKAERKVSFRAGQTVEVDLRTPDNLPVPRRDAGTDTLLEHKECIFALAYAPDGKSFLAAGGGSIPLWSPSSDYPPYRYQWSSSDSDFALYQYAAEGGRVLRCFVGHTATVTAVAFSADGALAASSSIDGTVWLWDVATGKERLTSRVSRTPYGGVSFSPDGQYLAAGNGEGTVYVWKTAGKGPYLRLRWELTGHKGVVESTAFSPDGRYLLSGGSDKSVRLWDLGKGKELRRFTGHTDCVRAVAFTLDGKQALSGSGTYVSGGGFAIFPTLSDPGVRLWEVSSGKQLAHLRVPHVVRSIALTPDGKHALFAAEDTRLYLFDLASRKQVKCYRGHRSWVTAVACSPEGQWALSGSLDGSIRRWELPEPGKRVARPTRD